MLLSNLAFVFYFVGWILVIYTFEAHATTPSQLDFTKTLLQL